eukprot:scaffold45149_cov63-Phaeocystis_antarctica.AAC.4
MATWNKRMATPQSCSADHVSRMRHPATTAPRTLAKLEGPGCAAWRFKPLSLLSLAHATDSRPRKPGPA